MNQRPPHPPQPLDAEERALAKVLPRLHGRSEPGPDLDARILAVARESLQPARATRIDASPRIRWIAPASLAASLLLAVGLAWRLRPLPVPVPVADAAQTAKQAGAAGENDMQSMRMIEPQAESQPVPIMESPAVEQARPAVVRTVPPAREQASVPADAPAASSMDSVQMPQSMPAPAPPSLPATVSGVITPENQARQRATSAGMAKPETAKVLDSVAQDALPPAAAKARMADSARPMPVEPETVNEADMAADAGFVDDPDENIPPATVDSPWVRDAWLQRIDQLLQQGNVKEAKASLAEFRHRYPDAALPPALHRLEIEVKP